MIPKSAVYIIEIIASRWFGELKIVQLSSFACEDFSINKAGYIT